MHKMRIALEDGFAIKKGTGIGQYTLNLFRLLKTCAEIEITWLLEKPFLNKIPAPTLRRFFYTIWLEIWLPMFLRRKKVDIVHFTNYLIPPLRTSSGAKYVVTVHDLTAWRFPETLPRPYVAYIRKAISHAIRNVDLILTDSNAVREEIIEQFDIEPTKALVAYAGISQGFWTAHKISVDSIEALRVKRVLGINGDFLLHVGTTETRKNILTAVKALKSVKNDIRLQLVLVGRPGYGFSALKNYLKENRLEREVIVAGHVPEETLIALYDLAIGLVHTSLYEGFGMPLVEAMVRGTPIVASKISSTVEIAGEAALYYSNNSLDYMALAREIMMLIENRELRQALKKKSIKRAQMFSEEKIRQMYIQAYLSLL